MPKRKPQRSFRLPHPQPVNALDYARFTGIPTFMRLPHITQPEELDIAIIGVPFDGVPIVLGGDFPLPRSELHPEGPEMGAGHFVAAGVGTTVTLTTGVGVTVAFLVPR